MGIGKKRLPGAGGSSVSLDPAIRSVFASRDGRKLLVGTRGGELYEMSTADGSDAGAGTPGAGRGSGGPLTAGHGRGQVGENETISFTPFLLRFFEWGGHVQSSPGVAMASCGTV